MNFEDLPITDGDKYAAIEIVKLASEYGKIGTVAGRVEAYLNDYLQTLLKIALRKKEMTDLASSQV
jgi:hypothetical protein